MELSFWEKNTFFSKIDVIVVGSGIVGLNAAIKVKELKPNWKVVVLERGVLPSGASSKNAGFACFGSATELLDDLSKYPEEEVFSLVEKRWKGLGALRKNLGDKNIGFKNWGGYEIFPDEEEFEKTAEKLELLNKKVGKILKKKNIYSIQDKKIRTFGFKGVKHLILNSEEGQINTGEMILNLLRLAYKKGVIVLNNLEVKKFEDRKNEVKIELSDKEVLTTRKLIITTNGFARQLIKNVNVEPARAQVLITEPIKDLKIKGTFHYQQGYYYFRNIGDRVLFGGGRNLDIKGETTFNFGLTDQIQGRLEELLKNVILPNTKFKVEQRWSGIMGVGKEKRTIIQPISDNVFCGVRMGGMGIAIGTLVGQEVATLAIA